MADRIDRNGIDGNDFLLELLGALVQALRQVSINGKPFPEGLAEALGLEALYFVKSLFDPQPEAVRLAALLRTYSDSEREHAFWSLLPDLLSEHLCREHSYEEEVRKRLSSDIQEYALTIQSPTWPPTEQERDELRKYIVEVLADQAPPVDECSIAEFMIRTIDLATALEPAVMTQLSAFDDTEIIPVVASTWRRLPNTFVPRLVGGKRIENETLLELLKGKVPEIHITADAIKSAAESRGWDPDKQLKVLRDPWSFVAEELDSLTLTLTSPELRRSSIDGDKLRTTSYISVPITVNLAGELTTTSDLFGPTSDGSFSLTLIPPCDTPAGQQWRQKGSDSRKVLESYKRVTKSQLDCDLIHRLMFQTPGCWSIVLRQGTKVIGGVSVCRHPPFPNLGSHT